MKHIIHLRLSLNYENQTKTFKVLLNLSLWKKNREEQNCHIEFFTKLIWVLFNETEENIKEQRRAQRMATEFIILNEKTENKNATLLIFHWIATDFFTEQRKTAQNREEHIEVLLNLPLWMKNREEHNCQFEFVIELLLKFSLK
jgi:hypothetical protein